jgi:hypothetical protein
MKRQPDGKGDPFFQVVPGLNAPPVVGDNLLNDGKTQPHPFVTGGEEGIEDVIQDFRGYALAGIAHLNDSGIVFPDRVALHRDGSPFFHGFNGIVKKVDEDLLDLLKIAVNQGKVREQVLFNLDSGVI